MLGSKDPARIADRVVADEYFAVREKVERSTGAAPALPADAEGPAMARLRKDHHRMLGNGYCTLPVELDCAFETICEGCTYFATTEHGGVSGIILAPLPADAATEFSPPLPSGVQGDLADPRLS